MHRTRNSRSRTALDMKEKNLAATQIRCVTDTMAYAMRGEMPGGERKNKKGLAHSPSPCCIWLRGQDLTVVCRHHRCESKGCDRQSGQRPHTWGAQTTRSGLAGSRPSRPLMPTDSNDCYRTSADGYGCVQQADIGRVQNVTAVHKNDLVRLILSNSLDHVVACR